LSQEKEEEITRRRNYYKIHEQSRSRYKEIKTLHIHAFSQFLMK